MTITLAAAMRDVNLLGAPFQAPSFWTWHTVAKVISGEPLDEREAALFRECTGRTELPKGPVSDLTLLGGRRTGKDRFMSATAIFRAALAAKWQEIMSAGEMATVILLGADKKQARILRRYCQGLLEAPMIKALVSRDTDEQIEFKNGAALEITTNDAALVRGRSAIAVLGTEVCFWQTDAASSSSDEEVVAAAEPGMAMIPDGGLMIMASSVHRKKGYMYRRWKELHGNNEAEAICWLAPSRTMNPALPEKVVAKAMSKDPQRAGAEFGSQWRDDVSDFIPREVVEAATDFGVRERAPLPDMDYVAFTDAAGGTGKDAFSLAIAHRERDGTAVLDFLRERKPRFIPAAVVKEYAAILKLYRITSIRGDRYSAGWNADEWARAGIKYEASELTKSELYLAALPMLLSGQVRLLDNQTLRDQFVGLERRVHSTGRESVDDNGSASANDDSANACAGAIVQISSAAAPLIITSEFAAEFAALTRNMNSRSNLNAMKGH
ncbi:hypothetical protein SAMN05444159_7589 [Bradyrhizobium lablabi]|uniref:Terminase-like family protein n=1 Tax=Bradyrhizobium lablabi TaxID=722472 RepID=A0A1M7FS68_9BRAD|nr:hypothetical protein [Bradyrhizobium lablabi]SHM06931.1 hypothetical protein SAMN05444159_7589 [Bradyrhizobium lablabi]